MAKFANRITSAVAKFANRKQAQQSESMRILTRSATDFGQTYCFEGRSSALLAAIAAICRQLAQVGRLRCLPEVETEHMSSIKAGQLFAVETGRVSAVETRLV